MKAKVQKYSKKNIFQKFPDYQKNIYVVVRVNGLFYENRKTKNKNFKVLQDSLLNLKLLNLKVIILTLSFILNFHF